MFYTNGRFGALQCSILISDPMSERAEHVHHLDLVAVALRLAHPRPRAVWRCTINGPLCGGLAGSAREGGTAAGGASAPPREPFL